MRTTLSLPWLAAAASMSVSLGALAGCDPFNRLGVDETVTQKATTDDQPDPLADDRIEDKHPQYDATRTIDEKFGDFCTVRMNKSAAVTKLEVLPLEGAEAAYKDRVFPSYVQAQREVGPVEILPSMEVVQAGLKPFNDGLYAALELAVQTGADGATMNKRALLTDLENALQTRATTGAPDEKAFAHEAAVSIGAALTLGGGTAPAPLADEIAAATKAFDGAPILSRPIGFYTWSPELSSIFRQNRFLQSGEAIRPTFGAFAATSLALSGDTELAQRYDGFLKLYAGLTNPFFDKSVRDLTPIVTSASALANPSALEDAFHARYPESASRDAACAAHLAFFPASDSAESALFRSLTCSGTLPGNKNLIDVLIDQIRSGKLDLTPKSNAGWYDRQTYALETLLVPERGLEKDNLFLTKGYKQKLADTFKTIITENRETHVEQSGIGGFATSAPAPTVDVYPLLVAEPFPTFYLRTARAYAFVYAFLRGVVGDAFFASTGRVLEGGKRSPKMLGAELKEKIELLYGLHLVTAASIGSRAEITADEGVDTAAAEARARAWLATWSADSDVAQDPRVVVPVIDDVVGGVTKYWAVIGTKAIKIRASFYPDHLPETSAQSCVVGNVVSHDSYVLVGQQVEITRPRTLPPLTRDELRAICDRNVSSDAIVKALSGK